MTLQVTGASADAPCLGLGLALDAGIVAELLPELPDAEGLDADGPDDGERDDVGSDDVGVDGVPGLAAAPATDDVVEPLHRLLRLAHAPRDIRVLAPLVERELYYRLLQGPMGGALRATARGRAHFAQIRGAAQWIRAHATEPMSIETLAGSVNMSVTSFHRHFKAITGSSPLAYQRHLRLLEARRLLGTRAMPVTVVAFAVGYASASHFSREYKRMFGHAPARDSSRSTREPGGERNGREIA